MLHELSKASLPGTNAENDIINIDNLMFLKCKGQGFGRTLWLGVMWWCSGKHLKGQISSRNFLYQATENGNPFQRYCMPKRTNLSIWKENIIKLHLNVCIDNEKKI